MTVRLTAISADPLDVAAHVAAVSDSGTGAVASFIGTVRDHSPDAVGTVTRLEYSAHPDAPRVIAELAERVATAHPEVALAVSHRTGEVAVGELAIVACAGSAHRAEAFDACRELVEVVKAELPMWKKQFEADGSHTWVGSA